ncbi:hypothetical protein [Occultella aeris]|uniref:hypothetical protein n=1 Tax=Occultella aeris TaxID=2761496 RepID=UPI0012EA7ECF|nr:hypothetical protein [Occultella aeris]
MGAPTLSGTYELQALWVNIAVGFVTLLAAGVPLVLFLVERRDRKAAQDALDAELRRQREAERRRAEEELLAGVRRIAVWPQLEARPVRSERVTMFDLAVHVTNHSDNPVFELVVNTPIGTMLTEMPWQIIKPGEEKVATASGPDVGSSIERPRCWVEFTDVSGRRWARYTDGDVVRLDGDQLASSITAEG